MTIRAGRPDDVDDLCGILAEPTVAAWWGEPEGREEVAARLLSGGESVLLVVEVGGAVAGGIEYSEEHDAEYRHAGIDVYLSSRFQRMDLLPEELTRAGAPPP